MEKVLDRKFFKLVISSVIIFCSCKKNNEQTLSISKNNDNEKHIKVSKAKQSLCKDTFLLCKEFTDNQSNKTFFLFEEIKKTEIRDEIEEEDIQIDNKELHGELYFNEKLTISFFDKADCYTNGRVSYLKDTFSITDLDNNGIKEIIFLYELVCDAELEPSKMKLIMIEGESKYKIRGSRKFYTNTDGSMINEDVNFNIDKSFSTAPRVFLEYATDKWNENLFDSQIGELNNERLELMKKDKLRIIKIKNKFE
jgi:hypothetical protein